MRSDKRRNREAMLTAARRLFSERGLAVPLDVIAREAGVSRATQHRHFPTRASLVLGLFDENLARLSSAVEGAPSDDAFFVALYTCAEIMVEDRGFVDLFDERDVGMEARRTVAERFLSIIERPLRQAQAAGKVRSDLEPGDVRMLVDMLSAASIVNEFNPPANRPARGAALLVHAITPSSAAPPLPDD